MAMSAKRVLSMAMRMHFPETHLYKDADDADDKSVVSALVWLERQSSVAIVSNAPWLTVALRRISNQPSPTG